MPSTKEKNSGSRLENKESVVSDLPGLYVLVGQKGNLQVLKQTMMEPAIRAMTNTKTNAGHQMRELFLLAGL